jgi:hypothetical protein
MSTRVGFGEDGSQVICLPALDAAGPIVTLLSDKRAASKATSNCSEPTSVPADEARLTATAIPVAPGKPEAEPTESVALGAWAAAGTGKGNRANNSASRRWIAARITGLIRRPACQDPR